MQGAKAAWHHLPRRQQEDFSEDTSSFKVPCVIVTTSAENWSMEELSSVSIDDEKAGETIVDYLIDHGHTKIAEIGANLELSQTALCDITDISTA